jgi:hypothetical protein
MNRIFAIIILFFLTGNISVFSQQFSNEREKFTKEWQKILEDVNAQEFAKKELPKYLKSPKFTDSHFSKMVDACNLLYSKKVPIYPQLFQYMQCWVYQLDGKFSSNFNTEWQRIVKSYLEKEDQLNYFLEFSSNLFKYNTLSNRGDYSWSFEKGDLTWNTDKKLTIQCGNGNLVCRVYSQNESIDSITVYNTSGVYDVFKNKWEGRTGMMTWEKVKFDKTKTFANIRGYKFEMNSAQLTVDTVELTTPYFSSPILGRLEDKTVFELGEGEKSPKFNSFEKRLKIANLNENMDYDGGFTLEGEEFIGRGTIENPAKILLKYQDEVLFQIAAVNFEMNPQRVITREAKIKMFYKNGDSLVHNQTYVNLDFKKKLLSISAIGKGNDYLPYFDSYFKINVKAPLLNWNLNTPLPYYTFEVGTASEQRIAKIESINYFDKKLFQKYKGMGNTHPLTQIAKKVKENGKKQMKLSDFANALGQSILNAEILAVDMASDGFIQFNSQTKTILLEEKLFHFEGANSGERDFDIIQLISDLRPVKGSPENSDNNDNGYFEQLTLRRAKQIAYAVIDVNKNTMRINEVESVLLSQAQKTEIILDSSYITIQKDRDLLFSGWLVSGKFETHTKQAKFDYEEFKIQIPSSDYTFFRVNPISAEDANPGETIPMISSISHFKGEIQIDYPSNKSGKIGKNSIFPLVQSVGETFVYYNSKEIVYGAYDSLRFYYKLNPFEIDSLDNFNEKSFELAGHLVSGGIFPDLSEKLIIMNDYSFGFRTNAPEDGYPFYGTSTKYKNKIYLSGNGLQGAGNVDFVHSNFVSNKLTFLPDSTIGLAKFVNKQISDGVKFPSVKSDQAYICYQPINDLLKVSSYRETPLEMFDQEAYLMGDLRIRKTGIIGRGDLNLQDATLKSEKFSFTDLEFSSDLCSFYLRNRYLERGENPLSIQSDSLKAFVSLKERKGEFTSSGTKRIKFPPNEFYCQMDRFTWYMDKESIDLEKDKKGETNFESNAGLVKNNFYSLNKDQDSLQFKSLNAKYDLKEQTIFCEKVDFVEVGDARIFPDSNKLTIRKKAVLDPLRNAKIIANDIDSFHRFDNANIRIFGRNNFEGVCNYPYLDKNGNSTNVQMKSIKSESSYTLAKGEIQERNNFKLSEEFDYYGSIDIYSNKKGLLLDGFTRLNHKCKYDRSWMKFKDTIDAKKIQIPISEKVVNAKNEPLAAGFLWRDSQKSDSLQVYPAFLSKMGNVNDPQLFYSNGYIQFNEKANEFQIGSKNHLNKTDSLSNILKLHLGTCILTGLGEINLGINYGEVSIDGFGKIEYNTAESKTEIAMNARISMPVSKDVIESLGNKLKVISEFEELDLKRPDFELRYNFIKWLGEKRTDGIFKDYDEDRLRKMPEGINQTFVLAGLKLETVGKSKSGMKKTEKGFIAREKQVGLISVYGIPIMKMVDLQMFFNQTFSDESGQNFYWLFTTPSEKNYFMHYVMDKKSGGLGFYSTDESFMKTITDIKSDKRKTKSFKFDVIQESNALNLLSKFRGFFLLK